MKAASIIYHRAASLDEAMRIARDAQGTAKYLAGGQSLMPMMNLRLAMFDVLVDISDISDLHESRREEGGLFIGAGLTHSAIEDGKLEDTSRGYLRHVARGIAYRGVRNKGTMGGSLAHADPSADWPTALLALGSTAVILGEAGIRELALEHFQLGLMETCLGDTEILLGVRTPELSSKARWAYTKFTRKSGEFAHSIAAVVIDSESGLANVVLGAAAGKPAILPRLSAWVASGRSLLDMDVPSHPGMVDEDLKEVVSHDSDSYEFHLHRTMVTRALAEVLKP